MSIRIEIRHRNDATRNDIVRGAVALGVQGLQNCTSTRLYFLSVNPGAESIQRLCASILCDPVLEVARFELLSQDARLPRTPHHILPS